jgi:hypothetical protein
VRIVSCLVAVVFILVGCSNEAEVGYTLEPTDVAPGENPVATLSNKGSTEIEYGNPFTLEQRIGDAWEPIEDDSLCVFTLEAYPLGPGESKSQEITVCARDGEEKILEAGTYRVTKRVRVPGEDGDQDQIITSHATFRVIEP